jgi:hypothetical protein
MRINFLIRATLNGKWERLPISDEFLAGKVRTDGLEAACGHPIFHPEARAFSKSFRAFTH